MILYWQDDNIVVYIHDEKQYHLIVPLDNIIWEQTTIYGKCMRSNNTFLLIKLYIFEFFMLDAIFKVNMKITSGMCNRNIPI